MRHQRHRIHTNKSPFCFQFCPFQVSLRPRASRAPALNKMSLPTLYNKYLYWNCPIFLPRRKVLWGLNVKCYDTYVWLVLYLNIQTYRAVNILHLIYHKQSLRPA
jgi:hypothetical protein